MHARGRGEGASEKVGDARCLTIAEGCKSSLGLTCDQAFLSSKYREGGRVWSQVSLGCSGRTGMPLLFVIRVAFRVAVEEIRTKVSVTLRLSVF